ncbi:DUF3247 family protein [Stenotrophomonas sp. HITSZ_GD]|uniref:DUF3247 family protein n=1 Tax=Stenotrophomonas sp. HITSZ_GD TaxID=3037248 RepID=UPI00240D3AFD|nr:DUF3247 family protein [Stenotrophomonas sp. HITSZ_GD]MDG2525204.1 DUF3247 family protein [Stenotrophomonas sp. HITSZ_GD]
MAKYAEHVYTDQAQIAALEAWVRQLPDEARVQLTLDDGSRLLGTVAVRPTVQSFRDESENEGVNGLLRLDDLDSPAQQHLVWLDSIREVRPLPPIGP